jgi:hypothetical protein
MVEIIFTLDYEIYGDGRGSLQDLVYDPAQRLMRIFRRWNARFVAFVEAVELEKMEALGSDAAIDRVMRQINGLFHEGFEVGLHVHPQWSNALFERGHWTLDYSEYNLCKLPVARIGQIIDRSLEFLRHAVGRPDFSPISFRAGNWLFQPTNNAAAVLRRKGLKLDSSVFKGGLQRNHGLDYRRALGNGYYWAFSSDVNRAEPAGSWLEFPIYTQQVPLWRLATRKRLRFKGNVASGTISQESKVLRLLDFARFRYPLKLDFCRMTLRELTSMIEGVVREDRKFPGSYKPVVAIGHTKDLKDPQTVDSFLWYLHSQNIPVTTLDSAYAKIGRLASTPISGDHALGTMAGALAADAN